MTKKVSLANLPTKIYKLERLSEKLKKNIWIKRDDQTGTEFSGNKIRKLEYVFAEVIDGGYDTVITCGGIQSNHCRATAAAAVSLGIKPILLLRGESKSEIEGNYLLDKLFGADIRFCTPDEYRNSRTEIMENISKELSMVGKKAYVIPEGASFEPGCLGYYNCYHEIEEQEKQIGIKFDTIIVATGSGGTYAGLCIANKLSNYKRNLIGFTVCDDSDYFTDVVLKISPGAIKLIGQDCVITKDDINFNDKYSGIGYALSTPEELDFISQIAAMEAVILDPVYTGKAFRGMCKEIESGKFKDSENILFIHTGGLYGVFPKRNEFSFGK